MIDGKYWTHAWTLVEGCTPISKACDNCWLASFEHRLRGICEIGDKSLVNIRGQFRGIIKMREDRIKKPLGTRKPKIYAIWSDLFHDKVENEFIVNAFKAMALSAERNKGHIFLVLTKRPARMAEFARALPDLMGRVKDNVYFGTTVEDQETADKRIPELLKVTGKRFLSIEPMLGPIDISEWYIESYCCSNHGELCPEGMLMDYESEDIICKYCKKPVDMGYGLPIHQIILGGESGPGARIIEPLWVLSMRDQCAAAGVPFFFKGYGPYMPTFNSNDDFMNNKYTMVRRKKGVAVYRHLHGKEHNNLIWAGKNEK